MSQHSNSTLELSDVIPKINDTNLDPDIRRRNWDMYLEIFILVAISISGFIGNILVMKTTVKSETKFARQIMSLFFCLAMTDISICLFRVGLLIYILLHPVWDTGAIVCILWYLSLALAGSAIWENLLVGVQRLFILKAFPVFRKYCTIWLIVIFIVSIVLSQGLLYVCAFIGFDLKQHYDNGQTVCITSESTSFGSYFYRVVVLCVFTMLPLATTIACHFWIVNRIFQAGLTTLPKADDRDNFIKITKTALIRSFALFLCFTPFLVASVLDSHHQTVPDIIFRYLDYCLCSHSAISPFITLQDSDFGDAMPSRKSTKKRTPSISVFNSSFRRIGISVITSENQKTNLEKE